MTAVEIVTGEYPPDPGGVADYTAALAAALAGRGVRVTVWRTRSWRAERRQPPGESTCRRARGDSPGALRPSARQAARQTWLVQWVPQAYGLKSLNLPVCLWLLYRRMIHGDRVRIMFHEIASPFVRRPVHHNVLAVGHRLMAAVLLLAASKVDVSTPAWTPLLRQFGWRRPVTWMPIPSNVPADPPPAAVAAARAKLGGAAEVVGHFGTYGRAITDLLRPTLIRLCESRPRMRLLLVGRGASKFADALPAGRAVAAEDLPAAEVAAYLRAMDAAVQPFPDGATTRRGSLMACLANGVPTVTNRGVLSEPLWTDGPVSVVASPDPAALAATVSRLLDDPSARLALGRAGREYYTAHFALERTVERLLADAG